MHIAVQLISLYLVLHKMPDVSNHYHNDGIGMSDVKMPTRKKPFSLNHNYNNNNINVNDNEQYYGNKRPQKYYIDLSYNTSHASHASHTNYDILPALTAHEAVRLCPRNLDNIDHRYPKCLRSCLTDSDCKGKKKKVIHSSESSRYSMATFGATCRCMYLQKICLFRIFWVTFFSLFTAHFTLILVNPVWC